MNSPAERYRTGVISPRVANAPHQNRREYATVSMEPNTTPASSSTATAGVIPVPSPSRAMNTNDSTAASLPTKPSIGGKPAIDATASAAPVAT